MNKQLVQDIINAGNKAMNIVHVKYTIDTKNGARYYSYCGIYYDNNYIEFIDDYDNGITLSYNEIIGIRVGDV